MLSETDCVILRCCLPIADSKDFIYESGDLSDLADNVVRHHSDVYRLYL
jgi:hypothetical protein